MYYYTYCMRLWLGSVTMADTNSYLKDNLMVELDSLDIEMLNCMMNEVEVWVL